MTDRLNPVALEAASLIRILHTDQYRVRLAIVLVRLREGRVRVDRVVSVIQRLHPVIIELKVPAAAIRRSGSDAEALAGGKAPVGMVVAWGGAHTHAVPRSGQ